MTHEEVMEQVIHNIREILRVVNSIRDFGMGTAYNEYVNQILSIPEILIKDPDQSVRRPDWREGDLLRGWEIAVKYLKEEYGFVKVIPEEEKQNE